MSDLLYYDLSRPQFLADNLLQEFDKGHGCIEHRQYFAINFQEQLKCFADLKKWSSLNSIIMIKTKRELKEKTTKNNRFYIFSCTSSAEALLDIVRKHWHVENCLH